MFALKSLLIFIFNLEIIGCTAPYYNIENAGSLDTWTFDGFVALGDKQSGHKRRTERGAINTNLHREKRENEQKYYNVSYLEGEDASALWMDLDKMEKGIKRTHKGLSVGYKTVAVVKLSFSFPFYGHEVERVTIATGGFLYMSDFLHPWLTASQFIAPLMANFDPGRDNNSVIHYVDNTTHFAVQWENVLLRDDPAAGPFTFQVVLKDSGMISFGYQKIPKPVEDIKAEAHPVKVGVSDAYYMDREVPGSGGKKRRTIYEYSSIQIDKTRVRQGKAVILNPLPTCIQIENCSSCIAADTDFYCKWCHAIERCSDGVDRYRQQWLERGCRTQGAHSQEQCDQLNSNIADPSVSNTTDTLQSNTTGSPPSN